MAMVKCKKCHNEVERWAKKCPHCGTDSPGVSNKLAGAVLVAVIAGVVVMCSGKDECAASDKECQQAASTKAMAQKLEAMKFRCAAMWETQNKSKLRDPNSLKFDYEAYSIGFTKSGESFVTVPYRARNGFGGMNVNEAACLFDPATATVTSVLK